MGLFDITGLGSIADLAGKILEMFPNAEQRAKAATHLQDLISQVATQQSEINKAEAASGNWFASSWRPLCGYICVGGFAYATVIAPVLHLPPGNTDVLITTLFGMLGLGSLRSYEKVKGVR